jgi:hypothetical protein
MEVAIQEHPLMEHELDRGHCWSCLEKSGDTFEGICFFGIDSTWDDLMVYHYMIQMKKRQLRRERRSELDLRRERDDESSRRRTELSSTRNESVGARARAAGAAASLGGAENPSRRTSQLNMIPVRDD